jgi:hypothetical protein
VVLQLGGFDKGLTTPHSRNQACQEMLHRASLQGSVAGFCDHRNEHSGSLKISFLAELTVGFSRKMLPLSVGYILVSCACNATCVLFANGNLRSNIYIILKRSLLLITEEQLHYYFLRSSFSNFEQLCACFIVVLMFTKKNLLE